METRITEWGAALTNSLSNAMTLFFLAIPKIIGFAVILIVGWLIAAVLAKAIGALLRTVKFNDLAHRSGLAGFVQKMGAQVDSAGLIGSVVSWFVRLVTLVVAFDALGLPAVSEVLRQLLLWLPNVVVAIVILVIAGLAANAVGRLVRGAAAEADLSRADLLGRVASGVIWGFGVIVAVSQLGIATIFVNTLLIALVGALALAVGLAFGLGGRETAAQILRSWYARRQQATDRLERISSQGGSGAFNERRVMERRIG